MKQIETGLHSYHSKQVDKDSKEESKQMQTSNNNYYSSSAPKHTPKPVVPFVWIADVIPGSPADEAGLVVGDAVHQFGHIDHTNHENLGAVVNLVK